METVTWRTVPASNSCKRHRRLELIPMAKALIRKDRRRTTANERAAAQRPANAGTRARRAYELYLARGGAHGHDVEDWLQAERELNHASDD